MKRFLTIVLTAIVTAIVLTVVAIFKFGSVNVQNHTDRYVTTCNDVIVDMHDETVTDRIDFNIDVKQGFNLFTR
jgi:hypothetical protein